MNYCDNYTADGCVVVAGQVTTTGVNISFGGLN